MSFPDFSACAYGLMPADLLSCNAVAVKEYETACAPVCRRYHLTQTALDILLFLANAPENNTARDLCALRGIKSGIASVTVDSLIGAGYLLRERDTADRRIQRLTLTDSALSVVAAGRAVQSSFLRALLQDVTPQEFETLITVIRKIVQNAFRMKGGVPAAEPAGVETVEPADNETVGYVGVEIAGQADAEAVV